MGKLTKKILPGIHFLLLFAFIPARADVLFTEDTLKVNMDSLKAEMSACFVCSTIADQWYQLCPKVKFRSVKADSFVAVLQTLGRSKNAKKYQEKSPARDLAFRTSLSFKAEEANSKLCRLCRELHRLAEVGAGVRRETRNEYEQLIITTFANPALNARCANLTAAFPGRFGLIEEHFTNSEDSSGTDAEPVVIWQVPPKFPDKSIINRISGKVIVAALIDTAGKVKEARILKSSDEMFNEAALEAVRQWLFKPAVIDGKKVELWCNVPINFEVK